MNALVRFVKSTVKRHPKADASPGFLSLCPPCSRFRAHLQRVSPSRPDLDILTRHCWREAKVTGQRRRLQCGRRGLRGRTDPVTAITASGWVCLWGEEWHMQFEIREAPSGDLTWCLVDENGAVVARSLSTYRNPSNLNQAIQSIRAWAEKAPVVDATNSNFAESA